jgi:uncharacterized repeat protein (TIGR04138 family)
MDPDDDQLHIDWPAVLRGAGPYPREAFDFVREGLGYTVERMMVHAHAGALHSTQARHITGQQLSLGLRDFAFDRYGMLAPAVLRHWNILRTEDFGRIVYALIEAGVMSKSDEDSFDDFAGVYEFDEAFAPEVLSRRLCRG